jgi:primosomal protein N'
MSDVDIEQLEAMVIWFKKCKRVMKERRALNEVKWKFGLTLKEVRDNLKEASEVAMENKKQELIEKTKKEKSVDWEDMLEQALGLFSDALYDGKELNLTQKWAVDKVLEKTEKRRKKWTNPNEQDPLSAFDSTNNEGQNKE